MFRLLLLISLAQLSIGAIVSGNVNLNDESSSAPSLSGCEVHVQVLDTSIADSVPRVLGNSKYSSVSGFPIAYSVTYSPDIPPKTYYSLSAQIICSNALRYISDTAIPIAVGETGVNLVDVSVRAI